MWRKTYASKQRKSTSLKLFIVALKRTFAFSIHFITIISVESCTLTVVQLVLPVSRKAKRRIKKNKNFLLISKITFLLLFFWNWVFWCIYFWECVPFADFYANIGKKSQSKPRKKRWRTRKNIYIEIGTKLTGNQKLIFYPLSFYTISLSYTVQT